MKVKSLVHISCHRCWQMTSFELVIFIRCGNFYLQLFTGIIRTVQCVLESNLLDSGPQPVHPRPSGRRSVHLLGSFDICSVCHSNTWGDWWYTTLASRSWSKPDNIHQICASRRNSRNQWRNQGKFIQLLSHFVILAFECQLWNIECRNKGYSSDSPRSQRVHQND